MNDINILNESQFHLVKIPKICWKCLQKVEPAFLLEKIIFKCQLSHYNTNKDIGVSEILTKNAIWQINYTFIGLGKMSLDLAEDWRVIRASSRVTECAGGDIIKSQDLNILYFPVDTVILSHRLIPRKNILDTLYRLYSICSNL